MSAAEFVVEGQAMVPPTADQLVERLAAVDSFIAQAEAEHGDPGQAAALEAMRVMRQALVDFGSDPSQGSAEDFAAARRALQRLLREPVTVVMDGREHVCRPATAADLEAKRAEISDLEAKNPDGVFGVPVELVRARDAALLAFMENPSQYRWDAAAELQAQFLAAASPSTLRDRVALRGIRAGYRAAFGVGR